MSTGAAGDSPAEPKGDHGTPSEVNWEDGSGRQPYANQGAEEAGPATGDEAREGDRGDKSGRNLEQLEDVRKKP